MFYKKSFEKVFFVFVLLAVLFMACSKDEEPGQGVIPDVYVNFYIQPDGLDFMAPGDWKYYNSEGYRGIVVYRIDQFTFNAYERTCPYDPQEECARVEVDGTAFILVDSCCMSKYNILDGMPLGGPTKYPLKQYFTEYTIGPNGGSLLIYNTP